MANVASHFPEKWRQKSASMKIGSIVGLRDGAVGPVTGERSGNRRWYPVAAP